MFWIEREAAYFIIVDWICICRIVELIGLLFYLSSYIVQ